MVDYVIICGHKENNSERLFIYRRRMIKSI